MRAARSPMLSETRAPQTISLKMSWPMSFVPSRCRSDGVSNGSPVDSVGSYGATRGAKTPASAIPVRVIFDGRGRRRAPVAGSGSATGGLAMYADPWIEERVHELDEKVGGDDRERRDDEAGLEQRIVSRDHGLEQEPPQARI